MTPTSEQTRPDWELLASWVAVIETGMRVWGDAVPNEAIMEDADRSRAEGSARSESTECPVRIATKST